jgi:mRNA interferase MazF
MQRGDVFRARLPTSRRGHEQAGVRYAVVLQASELELSTVIVAPTSTKALETSFRPEIQVAGRRTRVLTEQIRTVDRRRLGEPVGRLTWEELDGVDRALETVLGLAR